MFSTEKIRAAIRRRQHWFTERSRALRLVDGAGDDLPGLIIEDYAGRWLVQTEESPAKPVLHQDLGYRTLYWKKLSVEQKAAPKHLGGETLSAAFPIEEFGLEFLVDFQAGYSQGIFLDQRDNRRRVRCSSAKAVLNTFAYTCAFGVAAAAGGSRTTNIDLSVRSLAFGRRNYQLNGLPDQNHEFLAGDVFDYLRRFRSKQRRFDLIILDPPTFSRNRQGKIFRAEKDFGSLVEHALECLSSNGSLLCCANTHRVSAKDFLGMLKKLCPRGSKLTSLPMPPDFTAPPYLKSVWIEI
jgi:23S rRNA (cytosine1962-C5)-methyltransferase